MNEVNLHFDYKARYCQIGEINEKTEAVWFVCHGYAQLATFFIKKFEGLDLNKNCIIAPEGLSRFYLRGFVGRVGATWMTKEDRLNDIENYVNYLDAVYKHVLYDKDLTNLKIIFFGFSQGVATICRWATQSTLNFDKLILWAGIIPPDMNHNQVAKRLSSKPIFVVYGDNDPYIKEPEKLEQQRLIEEYDLAPKTIIFNGEHDIHEDTLINLANN